MTLKEEVEITAMTQALVLAGAANRQPLVRWSESRSKAAVRLFGRPMIQYVLDALLAAKEVSSVTVAGAPDLVSINFATRQKVHWAPSGTTMVQSLKQGLSVVDADGPVLVVACDLPLLTSQAVDDFIRLARSAGGDVVYPVVPKSAVTTLGSGVVKRCLRTREGIFSAGNLALISGSLREPGLSLLERAHRWRKRPQILGSVLGWRAWMRLLSRRMSFGELERRIFEITGVDLRIVPVEHGCLAFDLDSPKDHLAALRCMSRRPSLSSPPRFKSRSWSHLDS